MKTIRSTALWLALALAAAIPAAAQRRPIPVPGFSAADDGRVVGLPVGAELVMRLPEEPGAGARWSLKEDYRIIEIGTARLEGGGRPGALRQRVFRVRITAGGRVPVEFRLRAGDGRTTLRRVRLRVDASSGGPQLPRPRGGPAQLVYERDAGGLVFTRLGQSIEIRLPARPSTGYRWEVLSSRNLAFEGLPGVRPGGRRYDELYDDEDAAVFRLHTTVDRADGFLTLALMPPGERPDEHRAIRTLEFQFTNRK